MSSREKPAFSVRMPPPPASVEAFVRGEAPVAEAPPADVQTSKRLVHRRDGRVLRRMTVYLPADLATKLRAHCAARDVDASDVLAELVERLSA